MKINDKINQLGKKERKKLFINILDKCYYETWLSEHGMSYVSPPVKKIKEMVYEEILKRGESYLPFIVD